MLHGAIGNALQRIDRGHGVKSHRMFHLQIKVYIREFLRDRMPPE